MKGKLGILILLGALVSLQSCDENTPPPPEPVEFLKLTFSDNLFPGEERWALATDDAGKVLDAHQLLPSGSYQFMAVLPPEKFNLTLSSSSGSPVQHKFYTYAGIAKGQEITLKPAQSTDPGLPNSVGRATIKLTNCDPSSTFNISDGLSYRQYSSPGGTLNGEIDLWTATSKILVSSRKSLTEPNYSWAENVTAGNIYTVDTKSMTAFPKSVSVPLNQFVSASITAKKAGASGMGYVMALQSFTDSQPKTVKFGYLDGFEEYYLQATSTQSTITQTRITTYAKVGTTLPESVTFPDNTFSTSDATLANLTFAFSGSSYTYRTHAWSLDTDKAFWSIYAPEGGATPRITELPEEFTVKYPLTLTQFKAIDARFVKYISSYSYSDFLNDTFDGAGPTQYEYQDNTYQVRN